MPLQQFFRKVLKTLDTKLESSSVWYRRSLLRNYTGGTVPHGYPEALWHNAVLKSQKEVLDAISQVHKLGLPVIEEPTKNWDSLAALDLLLRSTNKNARIFDAGGELYSMILPWLFLYGYKNLLAGNLVFDRPVRKGSIVYQYSDITRTGFNPEVFDAITCLSVIEHGVDLLAYFREMSRILKPGGVLITSADYFETQVDTSGHFAYGVPIHIFTKDEIVNALKIASSFGLSPTGPVDLKSNEKVVHWKEFDLNYTFIIFSLRKAAPEQVHIEYRSK